MQEKNSVSDGVSAEVLAAVGRVLAGETEAYSVIMAAYLQKLYRTALFLCGNSHTAEDLVQETFIDGYLKLGTLREREKIGGWLTQILKNKYLNLVTRTRRTEPEEVLEQLADRRTPETMYCDRESLDGWRKRLGSLSPALRETALLYFWYRLSMEQIAVRLSLPLGTVKRRIHDAREQLKKENGMDNMTKLPDSFLETVQKKVDELAKYHRIYGTMDGFDKAYEQVKELIGNLSYAEDVKEYAVKSSAIAYDTDNEKYGEEALETARKYGDVNVFSRILLKNCRKLKNDAERVKYTTETILPAIETFADSENKDHQRGYHRFMLARYADKSTEEGIAEAERQLTEALEYFRKPSTPSAWYGNTIAGLKALEFLRDTGFDDERHVHLSGEKWAFVDGHLRFMQQPGTLYASSDALSAYDYPIFYFAGAIGDRFFFPKSMPPEAGVKEEMINSDGESCGWREIVSMDDTVTTPAGTFTGCMHLRKTLDANNIYNIWYKEGIGIVRETVLRERLGTDIYTAVLTSCEIKGGSGYLPLAVGNTWRYERPERPDVIHEVHEFVIEQMDDSSVSLSAVHFAGMEKDWEEKTDDPMVLLTAVSRKCGCQDYESADALCRRIIMDNQNEDAVALALGTLEYLEEKRDYDRQGWRFCPSSVNGSYVNTLDGRITYAERALIFFDTGVWGSRSAEDRIFGVKPFRYLQLCAGSLWDPRWVPGFTGERTLYYINKIKLRISVEDGGTVVTPAGTFENCLHLVTDGEVDGMLPDYRFFFYNHTPCGHKEFWFAPGVGVVRFLCDWGGVQNSDCVLSEYKTVAKDGEYMPVYRGNRWRYDELTLTGEGYIARRDYRVASGMNGRYLLVDNQMFTFRGDTETYEAFKRSLTEQK